MSIEKNALAESVSVPVPAAGPIRAAERRTRLGLRAWLLTAFLFLAPAIVYWPATFHDYGLRDDYSNLREAHEEPGKVLRFCASDARPIYGWLLQSTYRQAASVENLQWLRFSAALLLGAISFVCFRGLRGLGWHFNTALCFAVLVGLLPSAQVIAGWAVGWPYAAAALLAIGGFFTVEGAMAGGRFTRRTVVQYAVAAGLMVVSALIYQPSALFYVVPLAGALIVQRHRNASGTARWMGTHLGFVALTLGLAYCAMSVLYAAGIFQRSGRIAFEHHWIGKIFWMLGEPLPNALSLFVLNDDNQHDHALYVAGALAAAAILIAGAVIEWRRHGRSRGLCWVAGLVGLPIIAFSVSLLASERYATYRTIFAMTAVLLCFLIASARMLTETLGAGSRRAIATAVMTTAFLCAQHHAYALLAVTQGNEWGLIFSGAKHVRLDEGRPRIFAIRSEPGDRSTATIYHDEFGSLSSNSEWVPREMFERAMHDLHPEIANIGSRYDFVIGTRLPAGRRFDMIIDLRRLRRFYTNN
jgi:hypothetical protein